MDRDALWDDDVDPAEHGPGRDLELARVDLGIAQVEVDPAEDGDRLHLRAGPPPAPPRRAAEHRDEELEGGSGLW